MRFEEVGWGMEDLEFKIENEGLWIEDRQSRFEDLLLSKQHLIDVFLFNLCCKSRHFEDFLKL